MTQWENMLVKIEQEYENYPKNFLRQPTIARTVHPAISNLSLAYYKKATTNQWLKDRAEQLKDPSIGNPVLQSNGMSLITTQSMYYIYLMIKHLDVNPITENLNITDIGGGYGNMARIFRTLGSTGDYSIIDFPIMHKIQKDFLSYSKIEDVNFKSLEENNLEGDMLIATFSINEMPLEDRKIIENKIQQYDKIFIGHNKKFDGIDNIKYFTDLQNRLEEKYNITRFQCDMMGIHRYFVGVKK